MYVGMYLCMCACVYVRMYVCMYVCMYMFVYIHSQHMTDCVYIYTHAYLCLFFVYRCKQCVWSRLGAWSAWPPGPRSRNPPPRGCTLKPHSSTAGAKTPA